MKTAKGDKAEILLYTCLLTSMLDAIAAVIMGYKLPATTVFRYIASGWFGQNAFTGSALMVWWGVLFHFLIAVAWTCTFFFLYPIFRRLFKNQYTIALVYGILIWAVMNFGILPYTHVVTGPGHFSAPAVLEGIFALIICVGLPVALIAEWYYNPKA